jgi:hypothetical protein
MSGSAHLGSVLQQLYQILIALSQRASPVPRCNRWRCHSNWRHSHDPHLLCLIECVRQPWAQTRKEGGKIRGERWTEEDRPVWTGREQCWELHTCQENNSHVPRSLCLWPPCVHLQQIQIQSQKDGNTTTMYEYKQSLSGLVALILTTTKHFIYLFVAYLPTLSVSICTVPTDLTIYNSAFCSQCVFMGFKYFSE